jgi:hypothetical protein
VCSDCLRFVCVNATSKVFVLVFDSMHVNVLVSYADLFVRLLVRVSSRVCVCVLMIVEGVHVHVELFVITLITSPY